MEEMKRWRARWIWTEGLPRESSAGKHQLACFRRAFEVPDGKSCSLVAHVSADSRYRLFLNGESVAVGPAKGDGKSHYYETVDLSDRLKAGNNVLAAQVLHYTTTEPWQMGTGGPLSIWRSDSGAFFLEGSLVDAEGEVLSELHTDEQWVGLWAQGYQIVPSELTQWMGGMECVDGRLIPHQWQMTEYDHSSWPRAVAFYHAMNPYGELTPWQLTARPIPPMYEKDRRFVGVTRNPSGKDSEWIITGGKQIKIQPGECYIVEMDAGLLVTGYLRLEMSGGGGTRVRMRCSECYEPAASARGKNRLKGIRDQVEGSKLIGDDDQYVVNGQGRSNGQREVYEPFWFRTFRYVRLEVEAENEPITLHDFGYRETGYPLEVESSFTCSDDEMNQLWELSINTIKRCMHETYEDCPYYEQLQYTMDTRLQMLFTYYLTTDDRLARRAIYDYHSSMLPSGMLQCRYPSMYPQVIPSFSLYWIFMLHEHYTYYGDLQFIKRYRHTMLAVLDWFERLRTPEGIVGMTPPQYWTHFDWVDEWRGGAPNSKNEGPMTLHSLMYATALNKAAQLLDAIGWKELAEACKSNAAAINNAVRAECWSEEKQYFSNNPNVEDYSQHPQVWAVLSSAVEGEQARELLKRTLSDPELPVLSMPMTYMLFSALKSVGMYEELAFKQWDRWRRFIPLKLTTLPEVSHKTPRSDCHAWSAVPLAEFPGRILGVEPGESGYERIRIKPHMGTIEWAKGTVITKKGAVQVDWRIQAGRFTISVEGPGEVPIDLILPDGSSRTFTGKQANITCTMRG